MYEAPIHLIFDDIKIQLDKNVEDCVYSAVQNVGVNVDREELVKALNNDRGQYQIGFHDGQVEALKSLHEYINARYINSDLCHPYDFVSEINFRLQKLGENPYVYIYGEFKEEERSESSDDAK